MDFREYSKTHRILMDGAMGTYYAAKYGGAVCEYANLEHPDRIKEIHKEYMRAGANLILTNTFAANETSLNLEESQIEQVVRSAIAIAKEAVQEYKRECEQKYGQEKQPVFLAGDIGKIPEYSEKTEEELLEESCRICDIYLEEELPVLVFETFSELSYVKKLVSYIRKKNRTIFLAVSVCLNKNGYTSSGMSGSRLLGELAAMEDVDACGVNCGIGSGHMYQLVYKMQKRFPQKYFMAEPNAGYPEQFQNRMVFMDNAEYFANNMKKMADLGVWFLGGCCGTTPDYIALLAKKIDVSAVPMQQRIQVLEEQPSGAEKPKKWNDFQEKLKSGRKVIAVEVDPPYHAEYEKVMECAWKLKQSHVDIITMADSPMGRSRVDSILMSVKIANETGMTMMPHLCCRDRNLIAIRSAILGAYVNGIRNMLIVTGDPVPSVSRNMTTGVFDYHSIKLMKFLKEMNEEHFADDPICYGGALNQGRGNLDAVIKRMQEKMDAGASYFLTQPIYSEEEIERIRQIKERVDTKILCGIMPLVNYGNANFIKHEVTSIHVPDEIIAQYSPDMSREEGERTGARIANEIIEKLAPFADGYYIMLPFNRVSLMNKLSFDREV